MLFLSIPSPDLAGLAVEAGFSTIILDCEHGFPIGSEITQVVAACHGAGGRCIVRLAPWGVDRAASIADMGADGFVLSLVRSLSEITALCGSVSPPPRGRRSVNPFVPAVHPPGDLDAFSRSASAVSIWAMAETTELSRELRGLSGPLGADLDAWTGLLVGPYDLAASIGIDASARDDLLGEAVAGFAEDAARLERRFGLFVRDGQALERWRAMGIYPDAVVLGYDRDMWFQECLRRTRLAADRPGKDGEEG